MAGVRIEDIEVDRNATNKLAQKLTSSDSCIRRRTMKKLRRRIEHSAGGNDGLLNEVNLLRLWKGLHYCMWIADDPQFQEELAENMASLVSCFVVTEHSLLFVDAFLKVETQEWPLLDFHRLDKFTMLARKMLKSAFQHLQSNVTEHLGKQFVNILEKSVFVAETKSTNGFITHIRGILTEELENLGGEQVPTHYFKELVELLRTKYQSTVSENVCQNKGSGDCLQSNSVEAPSDSSSLKKRKRKFDCDDNELMKEAKKAKMLNTSAEGSTQENSVDGPSEDLEINIWVPNKKYNGALKAVAARHFQAVDKHCRTVSPKRTKAAADLFVTPKSDPTHRAQKRVSFALNQNKAQNISEEELCIMWTDASKERKDYEDSLIMTPKLTFDPNRKPVKGVLKFSPGVPERQKKSTLFKRKKSIKRFKGKKFF